MEQFSLTDIKKKNLSDVYQYIYMNPSCSKQEIATALSVSLPTVTQHLTTLESQNLIEKCGRLSSSVGRRAVAQMHRLRLVSKSCLIPYGFSQ